jgi:TonB family protein
MKIRLLLSLIFVALAAAAQDGSKPKLPFDVKRCTPKVVKQGTPSTKELIRRKGEKATGYSPLVSFGILESGKVVDVRLKRSSGFKFLDDYALSWIRTTRYNNRSGCGTIDTEAGVSIDF